MGLRLCVRLHMCVVEGVCMCQMTTFCAISQALTILSVEVRSINGLESADWDSVTDQ